MDGVYALSEAQARDRPSPLRPLQRHDDAGKYDNLRPFCAEQWADHGVDFVTLADDNLMGDRAYCRQMLRAVADWNRARAVPISLYAEMSVDAVRDPELLELCRRANITEMFLGVETPRNAGLRETLKMQNVATDLISAVKTIQSYGMVTVAGMIIGFDSDDAWIAAGDSANAVVRAARTDGPAPEPRTRKQHAVIHKHRAGLHAVRRDDQRVPHVVHPFVHARRDRRPLVCHH